MTRVCICLSPELELVYSYMVCKPSLCSVSPTSQAAPLVEAPSSHLLPITGVQFAFKAVTARDAPGRSTGRILATCEVTPRISNTLSDEGSRSGMSQRLVHRRVRSCGTLVNTAIEWSEEGMLQHA
jgi:hypothetical protein